MSPQAPGRPSYSVSIRGALSRYFAGKRSCHRFNGSLTCESASSNVYAAITTPWAQISLAQKRTDSVIYPVITFCQPHIMVLHSAAQYLLYLDIPMGAGPRIFISL